MTLSFRRKPKLLVGLDIGSSAVKAVELRPAGKGFRVAAFASEPVPPDAIVDGAIIDAASVSDVVRRIFDGRRFKTREVALSLAGNAVIVKKIGLPQMTESELADSIHWEAEQYIPFDIQDVNLDYQVLGLSGPPGKQSMDVLLVAAKKDKIADYTGVVAQAGCTPVVVDVDAFALQNCHEANYGPDGASVIALLNVGASAVNVNIVSAGQPVFTRDITLGGNAYTEAIQREFSVPFEAAETLKRGQATDIISFDEVRQVLRAVTDSLLLEVQKTFDFFKGTATSDRIDRVMLAGGGSRVDGLAEALESRFGAPVERLDPFKSVAFDAARLGTEPAPDVGTVAGVAVGLALRRAGDR